LHGALLVQVLSAAGFKSCARKSNADSQQGAVGGAPGSSTSDVMAAKRAAKEAKLRDVTFKLIVSAMVKQAK